MRQSRRKKYFLRKAVKIKYFPFCRNALKYSFLKRFPILFYITGKSFPGEPSDFSSNMEFFPSLLSFLSGETLRKIFFCM